MANINVSELLLDTDFINSLVLIHRTSTVNTYGENVISETEQSTVGSVQPISGKDLERVPESLRMHDVRSFWIKAEIVSGEYGGAYPDIIVFNGKRFEIKQVESWANWGAGWYKGFCVVEQPGG